MLCQQAYSDLRLQGVFPSDCCGRSFCAIGRAGTPRSIEGPLRRGLRTTMTDFVEPISFAPTADGGYSPVPIGPSSAPAQKVSEISSLLNSLDEVAAESGQSLAEQRASAHENKLVQARLGMASGLYAALRAKHPPTASHCLRVALGCSSWAAAMELDDETRDSLEVAALLHDVGKIGVPDKVLLKPGRLQPEEIVLMSRHAARTIEILASCGVPQSLIEIVHYSRSLVQQATAIRRTGRATSCRWHRGCCRSSTPSTR